MTFQPHVVLCYQHNKLVEYLHPAWRPGAAARASMQKYLEQMKEEASGRHCTENRDIMQRQTQQLFLPCNLTSQAHGRLQGGLIGCGVNKHSRRGVTCVHPLASDAGHAQRHQLHHLQNTRWMQVLGRHICVKHLDLNLWQGVLGWQPRVWLHLSTWTCDGPLVGTVS